MTAAPATTTHGDDRRSAGADARLRIAGLGVHFGDRSALEQIDVDFCRQETVSLVGPNGAGKSTLLKVIAGVLPPTHGTVRFDGEVLQGAHPAIVYVPQRTGVDWTFPVSVLDVVLMARARRASRWRPFAGADRSAAQAALATVGMERFADVQIGQLSGGQQQRVVLARALLQEGEVYLLDEPFTGVDVPTQELVVTLFDELRTRGKTIIYATHDLTQAIEASDRIFLLNRRLIAAGPPRTVMNPVNLRAAFGGQAILPVDPAGDDASDAP